MRVLKKKTLYYQKLRRSLVFRILIILPFSSLVVHMNCAPIKKLVNHYSTDDKDNLKKYQKNLTSIRVLLGVQLITIIVIDRSSRRRCSVRKGVVRNSAKFTRKHLCQSFFFLNLAG